jgi:hypothetical protein
LTILSIVALAACGLLLVRRLVLAQRFHTARVVLLTALLYCLLFIFIFMLLGPEPDCLPAPPPPDAEERFFLCSDI